MVACDVDQASVEETAELARQHGVDVTPLRTDVTSDDDIGAMVSAAIGTYGQLDVLCNNAGIMDGMRPVHEIDDATWQRVLAVNLTGPFLACRRVLPVMIEQGHGTIVNTASAAGVAGARAGSAYTASKHGLVGLTRNIAFMYAEQGIRCNAVCPGGVETNIGTGADRPSEMGMERAMKNMASMPRVGSPDEIAQVAVFLASDAASFVNGALVTADGGWLAG